MKKHDRSNPTLIRIIPKVLGYAINYLHISSKSVVVEFMERRSPGRLRHEHIYSDSEEILYEIASDWGVGDKFKAWIKYPGYIPETVYYTAIGWPERIILNDSLMKEVYDELKK